MKNWRREMEVIILELGRVLGENGELMMKLGVMEGLYRK